MEGPEGPLQICWRGEASGHLERRQPRGCSIQRCRHRGIQHEGRGISCCRAANWHRNPRPQDLCARGQRVEPPTDAGVATRRCLVQGHGGSRSRAWISQELHGALHESLRRKSAVQCDLAAAQGSHAPSWRGAARGDPDRRQRSSQIQGLWSGRVCHLRCRATSRPVPPRLDAARQADVCAGVSRRSQECRRCNRTQGCQSRTEVPREGGQRGFRDPLAGPEGPLEERR
mmetsp:Transcript_56549/g.132693  ORF Transcript_56549/g.132693 Transcript_56549/m.132693 type:complete len:229 (+) Transcript_56549:417-1103(+)